MTNETKTSAAPSQSGLFAVHNFVRPEEEAGHTTFAEAWSKQLAATGPAEEAFAIEITRAAWRLRRCALT